MSGKLKTIKSSPPELLLFHPLIGLILRANKKDTFVEYTLEGIENDIVVSKYLIELPKIEDLKRLIETDMKK